MGSDPLSRLADIDLPAPPDWQPLLLAVGLTVVLLPLSLWLGRRLWHRWRERRMSAAQQALREIDPLLCHWQRREIDDREAGYRLAALLRLGLGMDQVDEHCPPPLSRHRAQWGETIGTLQRVRYQATPSSRLRPEDFMRVRQWLTAAGRPPHREALPR